MNAKGLKCTAVSKRKRFLLVVILHHLSLEMTFLTVYTILTSCNRYEKK